MYPSFSVSYDLAQARMADLRHQARRESLARAVARPAQTRRPRVPGSLRLRHRAAAAAS